MKILLIPPAFQYPKYPTFLSVSDFPAGIAYIAGALKKAGHQVFGCNPNNKPGYKSAKDMITAEIISSIESCKPDLMGLGGICTDYAFIKDAIKIIRESYPTTPIVLGGNIVTNDAEFIFNDLKPDFAIVGEGEEAIVKLANALSIFISSKPVPPEELVDGFSDFGGEPLYLPSLLEVNNLWYWEDK